MPRLWIDMTNSPHVLVLRPVIDEFRRRGWDVEVTAREFAQTLPLLERFSIPYTSIDHHRGRDMLAKAWGLVARSSAMVAFGRRKGPFDLAVSHASNDLPVAAWLLGIPHVTMFDYEFAKLSHSINVRLSAKSLVPDAIAEESLDRYGGRGKVDRYPGLKEEYFLSDFEPDAHVVSELGLDPSKILVVLRTPPSMAAYHRMDNPIFDDVLRLIASRDDAQAVVLVRTPDQRAGIDGIGASNIFVPTEVVDAQSLVYYADVVVSGGGTLNREAVALGTPAWTVFQGVLGAVDAKLLAEGRMHRLERAGDIELKKKTPGADRVRRPVADLVDRMTAVARRR